MDFSRFCQRFVRLFVYLPYSSRYIWQISVLIEPAVLECFLYLFFNAVEADHCDWRFDGERSLCWDRFAAEWFLSCIDRLQVRVNVFHLQIHRMYSRDHMHVYSVGWRTRDRELRNISSPYCFEKFRRTDSAWEIVTAQGSDVCQSKHRIVFTREMGKYVDLPAWMLSCTVMQLSRISQCCALKTKMMRKTRAVDIKGDVQLLDWAIVCIALRYQFERNMFGTHLWWRKTTLMWVHERTVVLPRGGSDIVFRSPIWICCCFRFWISCVTWSQEAFKR